MPTAGAQFSGATKSSRAMPISRTISSSTSTSMVRMAAAVELRTRQAGRASSLILSLNWPQNNQPRPSRELSEWTKNLRQVHRGELKTREGVFQRLAWLEGEKPAKE